MRKLFGSVLLAALAVLPVVAQKGDKRDEVQKPLVPVNLIPPSPPLSPVDALAALAPKPVVTNAPPAAAKLSAGEMKRFEAGKVNYETFCLPCHQPHGLGQEGLAPPLVGSEWVGWSEERVIRIVLHGLRGPIQVKGQPFEQPDMPALGVLDDEQIATVLTYVRNEWGHAYPPISTNAVQRVRNATADRADAWTQEELLKIK